jgi:mannose-6-phosphate isomerase-like protein (cupin superfamily)
MKREKFLAGILAATALPIVGRAFNHITPMKTGKGFKISKGEGRLHGHITLKGVNSNVLDVKVSGTDTGGSFAVFEQTSLSQGRGTPLHIHHTQDEVFYVLEGEYYFKVGDDIFWLRAGDSFLCQWRCPTRGHSCPKKER